MTLVATTIPTVLRKDVALILQVKQGPVVVVTTQVDAASLAAVTPIGSAVGVVLHVAQVHRPTSALS